MSVSNRRDKRVGFHEMPPTSPSADIDASIFVESQLPRNSRGRGTDVVEPSSADIVVCRGLCCVQHVPAV